LEFHRDIRRSIIRPPAPKRLPAELRVFGGQAEILCLPNGLRFRAEFGSTTAWVDGFAEIALHPTAIKWIAPKSWSWRTALSDATALLGLVWRTDTDDRQPSTVKPESLFCLETD
jgi:hypothetical protein